MDFSLSETQDKDRIERCMSEPKSGFVPFVEVTLSEIECSSMFEQGRQGNTMLQLLLFTLEGIVPVSGRFCPQEIGDADDN